MPTSTKQVKILLFKMGKLTLAFPVDSVQKVTKYTPVLGSGLHDLGVANVEGREITVLDLHKRLFHVSQPRPSETGGYLLIARNSTGEPFGIIVGETPSLLDLPLSQLRVLPESYRRGDTLSIATHVTMIKKDNDQQTTVFIVDPDQLVPPILEPSK